MFKKAAVIAVVILSTLAFAGCGPKKEEKNEEQLNVVDYNSIVRSNDPNDNYATGGVSADVFRDAMSDYDVSDLASPAEDTVAGLIKYMSATRYNTSADYYLFADPSAAASYAESIKNGIRKMAGNGIEETEDGAYGIVDGMKHYLFVRENVVIYFRGVEDSVIEEATDF